MSAGGIILARFKLVDNASLHVISRIIFHLLLPCILFTSFAQTINLEKLKELWILPFTAIIYIIGGIALGAAAVKILKIKPESKSMVTAASGFANAMYLPIPLVAAICLIFPEYSGNPELKAVGMAYVSMFIIVFSPILWTVGFNIIGEKPHNALKISDIITPPLCGIIAGFIVANSPFLKNAFCGDSGFLHPVFTACVSLGNAVVPCAMIVLGGSFAFSPTAKHVDRKSVFAVILIKLIVLPLLAILYIKLLIYCKIIPHGTIQDSLLAIVILIQAAVPPASNLIVISALQKKNFEEMGSILQWTYLTSLVTLTLFIVLGMKLFR
jgi:hypothetical protein